jgi:Flp pilus assembly protein TadD
MLSHVYAAQGNSGKARELLERFAARHPDAAAPRTAIGIVLQQDGRIADAQKWFEQALAIDSREPVAAGRLARIYVDDAARVETAIDLARTAASEAPDDAEVRDTLGRAYLKSGRLRSAVSELERAVALNTSDAAYRQHLDEARKALAKETEEAKATEAASLASSR